MAEFNIKDLDCVRFLDVDTELDYWFCSNKSIEFEKTTIDLGQEEYSDFRLEICKWSKNYKAVFINAYGQEGLEASDTWVMETATKYPEIWTHAEFEANAEAIVKNLLEWANGLTAVEAIAI